MSSILCQCGNEACVKVVSKEGPNNGKEFFSCATRACKFFKWVLEEAKTYPPRYGGFNAPRRSDATVGITKRPRDDATSETEPDDAPEAKKVKYENGMVSRANEDLLLALARSVATLQTSIERCLTLEANLRGTTAVSADVNKAF